MYKNFNFFKQKGVTAFIKISDGIKISGNQCLVCDNEFHLAEDPKELIMNFVNSMEKSSFLTIIDRTVDIDDAKINTEEYFKNKKHRRFYRIEEIIDFTKDFFTLEFFIKKDGKSYFIFSKL